MCFILTSVWKPGLAPLFPQVLLWFSKSDLTLSPHRLCRSLEQGARDTAGYLPCQAQSACALASWGSRYYKTHWRSSREIWLLTETSQGQRLEILSRWFCREASLSCRGDSHQHELSLLLARCAFPSHGPQGWNSVNRSLKLYPVVNKSAGPQMIFQFSLTSFHIFQLDGQQAPWG